MIKQSIKYTDFNDTVCVDEAWFHASQAELATIIDLQPRLLAWDKNTKNGGIERQLTVAEIKELLDLVKILVQLAYGRRSDDGRYFRKTSEIWADFKDSGAHDAFLLELFENPDKMLAFFRGLLSKDILTQIEKEEKLKADAASTPDAPTISTTKPEEPFDPTKDFTPAELQRLSPDQLAAAWQHKSNNR